ncbi:hypothetical protein CDAR_481841 [Caerostris darwini]|uniref:Uncharacterized protein n=1 Tax=Caerostris darwini TaxID=1538125 RepID=A0AAV4VU35_9ARAC|nr:hypothetical protein CDAR_481841 [Caerostris darwini]
MYGEPFSPGRPLPTFTYLCLWLVVRRKRVTASHYSRCDPLGQGTSSDQILQAFVGEVFNGGSDMIARVPECQWKFRQVGFDPSSSS